MSKKKKTYSTSIVSDIYADLEEKVFDYLRINEYIIQCDAWMVKSINYSMKFEEISDTYKYFEDKKEIADEYFKKHSSIEKMTYYKAVKKHNALFEEFISCGMTPNEVMALNWNDCPEQFLNISRLNPNDFATYSVGEKIYEFNGVNQRIIVAHLHEKTEKNQTARSPELLNLVHSDCKKLRDVFSNGKHPAYNTLIVQEPEGSGNWKLNI